MNTNILYSLLIIIAIAVAGLLLSKRKLDWRKSVPKWRRFKDSERGFHGYPIRMRI
jgi:hypothetical protein